MKIYAITKGKYSDYHICALTIDKDKAEKIKRKYSDMYEDTQIEEFEDGEGMDDNLYWEYLCSKNDCYISNPEYGDEEEVCEYKGEIWGACLYAKDAEHARKKAQDMIAEYKARKEGIC